MNRSDAEIVREYGFPGVDHVHGVTYDGQQVWFAAGDKIIAFDPASGKTLRSIEVAADAGTAFDGQHLFQITGNRIQKIDPKTAVCSPRAAKHFPLNLKTKASRFASSQGRAKPARKRGAISWRCPKNSSRTSSKTMTSWIRSSISSLARWSFRSCSKSRYRAVIA